VSVYVSVRMLGLWSGTIRIFSPLRNQNKSFLKTVDEFRQLVCSRLIISYQLLKFTGLYLKSCLPYSRCFSLLKQLFCC